MWLRNDSPSNYIGSTGMAKMAKSKGSLPAININHGLQNSQSLKMNANSAAKDAAKFNITA